MTPAKMKVIEMDFSVLREYIRGCIYTAKESKTNKTWIDGHNKGIDDALKVVDNKNDLTFVMNQAITGLRHSTDIYKDDFYTKPNFHNHYCGYASGLTDTVQIITGNKFDFTKLL